MNERKESQKNKHKTDEITKIWLGRRGVVQTILENYRGQDFEVEIQEIQQILYGGR